MTLPHLKKQNKSSPVIYFLLLSCTKTFFLQQWKGIQMPFHFTSAFTKISHWISVCGTRQPPTQHTNTTSCTSSTDKWKPFLYHHWTWTRWYHTHLWEPPQTQDDSVNTTQEMSISQFRLFLLVTPWGWVCNSDAIHELLLNSVLQWYTGCSEDEIFRRMTTNSYVCSSEQN